MKEIDRRKFIGPCISVYGLTGFNDIGIKHPPNKIIESGQSVKNIKFNGKQDTKVTHWNGWRRRPSRMFTS